MAQFDVMISFSLLFNLLLVLYFYYFYNIKKLVLIYLNKTILKILKDLHSKLNRPNKNFSFLNQKRSYKFNHHCSTRSRRWYSSSTPIFMDPATIFTIFKSKAASSCTLTPFYPDINIWKYIGSVLKGAISDLTAPLLWKLIFSTCTIVLFGYGVVSIYTHAVEIYEIVQFYKQIVHSPELVTVLNHKYEILNHFNREAVIKISKLTFNLLGSDDCQNIVKYCIHNSEYKFHGILMDISNSNMI